MATTASAGAYYVHDGMVLSTGDVLVARIPGEIETATRVALAVAEAMNARHAEVEHLRGEREYLLSSLNEALNLLDAARTDLMAGQRRRVDDRWFGLVEELDASISPLIHPDDYDED